MLFIAGRNCDHFAWLFDDVVFVSLSIHMTGLLHDDVDWNKLFRWWILQKGMVFLWGCPTPPGQQMCGGAKRSTFQCQTCTTAQTNKRKKGAMARFCTLASKQEGKNAQKSKTLLELRVDKSPRKHWLRMNELWTSKPKQILFASSALT